MRSKEMLPTVRYVRSNFPKGDAASSSASKSTHPRRFQIQPQKDATSRIFRYLMNNRKLCVRLFIVKACLVLTIYFASALVFKSKQPHYSKRHFGIERPDDDSANHRVQPDLKLLHLNNESTFTTASHHEMNELQKDVRYVMHQTYKAYVRHCFGKDEINPVTNQCTEWFNIGLSIIESMDTLIILNLTHTEEYKRSYTWIETKLNFKKYLKHSVSAFELIIRALGGLLSTYELSSDKLFLNKAIELADLILPYFELSRTGCLARNINTRGSRRIESAVTSTADAGSYQLEFRKLSTLSNNPVYANAVDNCEKNMIKRLPNNNVVVPMNYEVNSGKYFGDLQTIGGAVDSFYEMMFKTYIAYNKNNYMYNDDKDKYLVDAFSNAMDVAFNTLYKENNLGYAFIGERHSRSRIQHEMEHLTCVFPGLLAVSSIYNVSNTNYNNQKHLEHAKKVMKSCYEMTNITKFGLPGDRTSFEDGSIPEQMGYHHTCFLRPEIIESLFYFNLAFKHQTSQYKDWGSKIWKKWRKYAQVPNKPDGVFGPKSSVDRSDASRFTEGGTLPSYVLAETFKYFFLLFDDRDIQNAPISPLRWVFTTEGHPLRIVNP